MSLSPQPAHQPRPTALKKPHWQLLGLLGVAVCAFLVTWLSMQLSPEEGQIAIIWPANAILLVLVLKQAFTRALWIFGAIFLGQFAADFAMPAPMPVIMLLVAANTLEIFIAARIIGPRTGSAFFQKSGLIRLFVAAIAAAGVSALIATITAFIWTGGFSILVTALWFAASCLGLLLFTPLGIVLCNLTAARTSFMTPRFGLGMLLLCVSTAGVFTQSTLPLLFVVPPILILLANIGGMRGAALAVTLLFLIATPLTLIGKGPIHLSGSNSVQNMLVYQVFLGACSIVALSAGAMASQRRELMDKLESAERQYRTLVEKSRDITLKYCPDGIITYASGAVEAIGLKPEDLIGRPLTEFMLPENYTDAESTSEDYFATEANQKRQFRVERPDQEDVWLEGNPKTIRNKAGEIVEIISTYRNVTERHQREVALGKAMRATEQAARAKSEFLSNMSHEIRTPMNAVLGMAQVLDDTMLSATQKEYVEIILDSGESLLAILNDILDLSKIDAGELDLNPVETELRPRIKMFETMYQATAAKKGLTFDVHIDRTVPEMIMADPVRVRQCVENLVTNAIKFTNQGGVQMAIRASDHDSGHHCIEVHIVDTGIGMTAEACDRVFEPFIQADGSTTRSYGGTGLGLPIARRLARSMGGDITAVSEPGRGSVFTFTYIAGKVAEARATQSAAA